MTMKNIIISEAEVEVGDVNQAALASLQATKEVNSNFVAAPESPTPEFVKESAAVKSAKAQADIAKSAAIIEAHRAANGTDNLDVSSEYEKIGDNLNTIGDSGDVLALGDVHTQLGSISASPAKLMSDLAPNALDSALVNFSFEEFMPYVNDSLLAEYGLRMNDVLGIVNPDWYWADKANKLYNYTLLSTISKYTIMTLFHDTQNSTTSKLVSALSYTLTGHRKATTGIGR